MWLQRFTKFVLEKRWQAFLLTFLITIIPIIIHLPVIGTLGILIAGFVTLRKGMVEGAVFTAAATLPILLVLYNNATHGPILWIVVCVPIISNILTYIFAEMLRRNNSWAAIMQIAALAGVLFISIIHMIYPNIATWWGLQLQDYYQQVVHASNLLKGNLTDAQLEAISNTKQFATGMFCAGALFNAFLQLMVVRWWEASIFNPGLLGKELRRIRLSHLAGYLYIASIIFGYIGNDVVLDVLPVSCLLFGVAGLSVVHYMFRQMHSPISWFWLLITYATLFFSLPLSIMLINLIALFDIWFDVRKKFTKI